ncbi:MAG TPA: hypothetical protein VJ206_02615 [bacterium]|nr:hypothetical protein [bacterium]
MDRVRRNGGTFGLVAAVIFAVLFLLVLTSGLTPGSLADPAKMLPRAKAGGTWTLMGVAGVLGTIFSTLFTVGLFAHLREKAPTRAYAVLVFGVVGSAGYMLGSLAQWIGGAQVAGTADQVAASHAWVALAAVVASFNAMGSALIGAALLVAGWAITGTRALSNVVGWVAVGTGVLTVLSVFTPNAVVFLLSFLLVIVWLAWAGYEMRRAA